MLFFGPPLHEAVQPQISQGIRRFCRNEQSEGMLRCGLLRHKLFSHPTSVAELSSASKADCRSVAAPLLMSLLLPLLGHLAAQLRLAKPHRLRFALRHKLPLAAWCRALPGTCAHFSSQRGHCSLCFPLALCGWPAPAKRTEGMMRTEWGLSFLPRRRDLGRPCQEGPKRIPMRRGDGTPLALADCFGFAPAWFIAPSRRAQEDSDSSNMPAAPRLSRQGFPDLLQS